MRKLDNEYADALAMKSDDELKVIIRNGAAYDAGIVALAREELLERTLGRRKQRTETEVAAARAERESAEPAAETESPQESEAQELLQTPPEPEIPLGKHVKRNRALFVTFGVLALIIPFVSSIILQLIFSQQTYTPKDELISAILAGGTYLMLIAEFGMLIRLAANRQTTAGIIIIMSVNLLFWVLTFIGISLREFYEWSIFFLNLVILYGWSVIIRNNEWKSREKRTMSWLILAYCIGLCIMIPNSRMFEFFWGLNYQSDASDVFDQIPEIAIISASIKAFVCQIIYVVCTFKMAFSSVFTENRRESPLQTKRYSPFNKYVIAGIAAIVITFIANAFLVYLY